MGYRKPETSWLEVDSISMELPDSLVTRASSIDIATNWILRDSNHSKTGDEARQTAKWPKLVIGRSTTMHPMIRMPGAPAPCLGTDGACGVELRQGRAGQHRDLRWLGQVPVKVRLDLGKVDHRHSNLGRMCDTIMLFRNILSLELSLYGVNSLHHGFLPQLLLGNKHRRSNLRSSKLA